MNAFHDVWKKLAKSKKYREHFVEAQVKRGIPVQIRGMMREMGLSQEQLASRAGLTQGVISRAASPSYGNLTLNTIIRVAAGFDVAFIGRFVPFSELTRWFETLGEGTFKVPTFDEEDERFALNTQSDENVAALIEGLKRRPDPAEEAVELVSAGLDAPGASQHGDALAALNSIPLRQVKAWPRPLRATPAGTARAKNSTQSGARPAA